MLLSSSRKESMHAVGIETALVDKSECHMHVMLLSVYFVDI